MGVKPRARILEKDHMAYDTRRHLPVPLPVEVEWAGGHISVEYAISISANGLRLHVRKLLPKGEKLHISFTLPTGGSRIEANATVVWTDCDERCKEGKRFCEAGICFEELAEADRLRIRRYAEQANH
jgi:hypothetical protein